MEQNKYRAECRECHTPLPVDHSGPCPECGKTGTKNVYIHISVAAQAKATFDRLKSKQFWKINWWILILVILLIFVSWAIGYCFTNILGWIVGVVLDILIFLLGIFAIERVHRLEHWRNS